MLPTLNLDDEQYPEISKRAKKLISTMYPEWTDYNEHDPGITLIELFAWLQEMQQYHLNQISKESYAKYLRLLGVHRKGNTPARVYLNVPASSGNLYIRKGCTAYAGDIPFETVSEEFVGQSEIRKLCSYHGVGEKADYQEMDLKQGLFQYFPFGTEPVPEACFEMFLSQPICKGEVISLYVQVYEKYPVERNPIGDREFYPLAEITYDYFDGAQWLPIKVIRDDTWQLITSGAIKLKIPEHSYSEGDGNTEPNEDGKDGVYKLRLTLHRTEYDTAPIIEKIHMNMIEVIQRQTLIESYYTKAVWRDGRYLVWDPMVEVEEEMQTVFIETGENTYRLARSKLLNRGYKNDCFELLEEENQGQEIPIQIVHCRTRPQLLSNLQEGDGFPNQVYELFEKGIIAEEFDLLIEDEVQKASYHRWTRVEDFDQSSPEDRHYIVDEEKGVVRFGDCIHGRAPEGRIQMISYAITKGIDGNVMPGKIDSMEVCHHSIAVTNYQNARFGSNCESIAQCFENWRMNSAQPSRAVTYKDYEEVVLSTPGLMVRKAKAIPITRMKKGDGSVEDHCIYLVVDPYTTLKQRTLSQAYLRNIYRRLEQVRMVGTKYHILSAEQIGISIYAEVTASVDYANPRKYIEQAVTEYVKTELADFGTVVLYSNIYGIIDTLECVTCINSLSLEASGRGITRSSNGDIILPPNGILYIQNINLTISVG